MKNRARASARRCRIPRASASRRNTPRSRSTLSRTRCSTARPSVSMAPSAWRRGKASHSRPRRNDRTRKGRTPMNFDFSDDQKQMRDAARKFLSEQCPPKAVRAVLDGKAPYDKELWKGLAEMGFLGVAIPEEFGGAGAGHLELCVIAEEMGRALAPVPFSSTVYLAAEALLLAGSDAQKQKWLPAIARGEAIGTLALFEGKGNPSPQAIKLAASGSTLNGVKMPVPDGAIADFAIVAACTGGSGRETDISLYLAELKGDAVETKSLTNIDPTRGQAEITFKNCGAEPLGGAGEGFGILAQLLDRAAVLMAFEQLGG